jgi:uroporphyrinogen decarboxylase
MSKKSDKPFIQACYGQNTAPHPPMWMMRQAGRYLPEYRAIRAKLSFEELCRTPEHAAEVTLQPIRRYDFDAAIIFSDILVVSDALGCPIHFPKGGPKAESPIRDRRAIDQLTVPDARDGLGFVMDALRLTRAALPNKTALIGFAGAPLTVAAYMVEGGASKVFTHLKSLIFHAPDDAHALLGKIAALTADYLRAQVEAGADAIQLFDTWASVLPKADFEKVVLPHIKLIFDKLSDLDVPKIYFAKGATHLLPFIKDIKCTVAGVDWAITINEARGLLQRGSSFPVQGNLDPVLLLGDEATMRKRVRALIDGVTERKGYIFNLGHGIIKETKPEIVSALVDEVRKS